MSPSEDQRAWLGVGLGLRGPHLRPLLDMAASDSGDLPAVLELTPSHFFARPERLQGLIGRCEFVFHDVGASLGTAEPLDLEHVDRVARLAARVGARAYSEHLAMTRSPGGIELGHLVPIPRTGAQLALVRDKLRALRDALELPVSIELPTTTLALPPEPGSLSEAAFVHELVDQSECGLHLDLENLWVDAHNALATGLELGLDPSLARTPVRTELCEVLARLDVEPAHARLLASRLSSLPLEAVTRVHLAGGHLDSEGWAVDSHSAPASTGSLALLEALRDHIDPRAIILERDAELPALAALLAELEGVEKIWQGERS